MRQLMRMVWCGRGALVALCVLASAGGALGQDLARVSLDSLGNQVDGLSGAASVSSDGVWVAFESDASNLVSGDTGGMRDVFVHNRVTRETIRVSEVAGVGGDGNSGRPSISADGTVVAFESEARNLVSGDMNGVADVFLVEIGSGAIERISLDGNGAEGDGESREPAVNADGRYVAFYSSARNLHNNDHNSARDVFVRYRGPNVTMMASVAMGGLAGNGNSGYFTGVAISGDGRRVAFVSDADDLVLGDTNGMADIFVYDITTQATVRVSQSSGGEEGDLASRACAISGDGLRVAFDSAATNLVLNDRNNAPDVFVHDLQALTTRRVSVATGNNEANSYSRTPRISDDGSTVIFESAADDLVVGDMNGVNDIFLHDILSGVTQRISQDLNGVGGDGASSFGDLGPDGSFAVFGSNATNFVASDTNASGDVFAWEVGGGCGGVAPVNYCISAANSTGSGAVMSWAGSTFVGNNDLALLADGAVPNQFGIFYYGPDQVLFVFGNGYRCVGGSVFRLPPVQADGGGAVIYGLDNTAPPQSAGQIIGGSTWNFQFWYRDPGHGAGFNLSDGLEIFFCP
ncbi:MAG: hypothetical protein QF724_10490 [Planctomycetota bacterium]|jgi:Tol biopolymer transport system component|nr:hypothetical protein [Planctomycetota bacterium]